MDTTAPEAVQESSASSHADVLAQGRKLVVQRRLAEAERCFVRAVALDPNDPQGQFQLGRVRLMQGSYQSALATLRTAVELDGSFTLARRYLAVSLVRAGLRDESLPIFQMEASSNAGRNWIRDLTTAAMHSRNLSLAGEYAAIAAELRWGRPALGYGPAGALPKIPKIPLSIPKLRHDAEQLTYLRRRIGVLGKEIDEYILRFRRIADKMMAQGGADARCDLDLEDYEPIRNVYNRLVYLRPTGRVKQALSSSWDATDVEGRYIIQRPGIVVVDDFLTKKALAELRSFCLESTVWFHNRYAYGRLGAFFQDSFSCPLLLQIGEELRNRLPNVIGDKYPLRQLWGFKNTLPLPAGVTTHADFAAINVNFWITPDDANLDECSGGLVLYDVDAPMHWDFDTYNGSDLIAPYLRSQNSRPVTIPYRQNRAVIFNSDLFHGTDAVSFRPEFENHRINVTMLYGDREEDRHHQRLARPVQFNSPGNWIPSRHSQASTLRKAR